MTLGAAIKLIRTARGIKQKDLAAALGVSANYISLLEKGEREPSLAALRKIASALGVPTTVLLMCEEMDAIGATGDLRELGRLLVHLQSAIVTKSRKRAKRNKAA